MSEIFPGEVKWELPGTSRIPRSDWSRPFPACCRPPVQAVGSRAARRRPGECDLESARGDSFYDGRGISAPSYTRPPEYQGHRVPDVLLSGNHAEIEKWRKLQERVDG